MQIEWDKEIERISGRIQQLYSEKASEAQIKKSEDYLKALYELKAYYDESIELDAAIENARRESKLHSRRLQHAGTLAILRLYESKVRVKRKKVMAALDSQTDESDQVSTLQLISALQNAENTIKSKIQTEQSKKIS